MPVDTAEDKPWFPTRYTSGFMPAAIENLLYLVDVENKAFSRQLSFRDHNTRYISTPANMLLALSSWNVRAEIVLVNDIQLPDLPLPAILKIPGVPEYMVLVEICNGMATYIDPSRGWVCASVEDIPCNNRGMAIMVKEVLPWDVTDYKSKQEIKAEAVNHYLINNLREVDGFLDSETCAYLIRAAEDNFEASAVGNDQGKLVVDKTRISRSAGLKAKDDPIVKEVMKKAAGLLANVPDKAFEMMQCVSYEKGGLFNPHFDTIDYHSLEKVRGYTVLINLNDEYEGGGTYFPELDYVVKPEKGKALIFKLLDSDGQIDQLSLHTGSRLTSGKKYMGVLFVRTPKQ